MELFTSQVAKIVGVHPNTVRLYEELSFISHVPRNNSGYRVFSERHVDEMLFARIIVPGPYPVDKNIVFQIINHYIKMDFETSLIYAKQYYDGVMNEKLKTHQALQILNSWNKNQIINHSVIADTRKEMSKLSSVPIETIRNWERCRILHSVKKNNRNTYTVYDYEKIMIIYILRKVKLSIQSIYAFFNNPQNEVPSDFFKEIYKNNDTICQTNEWIKFLDRHIEKSEKLIHQLKNKISNPPL